jgi:hypothetical protein
MNPVKALENHGQAVWLDFLARGFVAKGDLKKLIDTDAVKGVTSNPAIFEKAIGSSDEYDGSIAKALKKGDRSVADLFEAVAVEDIQNAADVLRPVYDAMNGDDGYVSLEVSPYLANDTRGTMQRVSRSTLRSCSRKRSIAKWRRPTLRVLRNTSPAAAIPRMSQASPASSSAASTLRWTSSSTRRLPKPTIPRRRSASPR